MEIDGSPWKMALQIANAVEWIAPLLETLPTESRKR
jgi:hypothetical protein